VNAGGTQEKGPRASIKKAQLWARGDPAHGALRAQQGSECVITIVEDVGDVIWLPLTDD